jgi:hypothetical protein
MLYPPITQQFTNSLESTELSSPSYSALGTAVVETTAHPKGRGAKGQGALIVGLGTLGHHVLKGIPRSWCFMMCHDVMMSWFQGFTMNMLGWFQGFANNYNIFGQSMDFCKLKPEKRICDGANHGFRWTFSLQQIEWKKQKSGEHVTFNKSMTPTIRKKTAQELKTARDRSQKRVWQHHFSMVVLVAMDIFGDMNGSILNCYITIKCLVTQDGCEIMWTWEMCRECDDMYMTIVISNSICSHGFVRNEYYRNQRPWDFSAHKHD